MNGKLAVVFGGGRDIGAAVAEALAAKGAEVALSYHGSDPRAVIENIQAAGGKVTAYKVDATDTAAVRAFAKEAQEISGRKIDILANVAGIMDTCSSVDNMTDAVYEPVMKVNLTVPMQLMRGVINEGGMKTRQIGVIINIASRAALGGAAFGAA